MEICIKSSANKCYGINKARKGANSTSLGVLKMVNKENLSDKVTFEQRPGEGEGTGQSRWREWQMQKSLSVWCAWPAEVCVPGTQPEGSVRQH